MEQQEEVVRVRLPRDDELIGEIVEMLGASRYKVACTDGRVRICRIPGKLRRVLRGLIGNLHVGDLLLIKPWSIEPAEKGDVEWIYTRTQAAWLRKKGYFK